MRRATALAALTVALTACSLGGPGEDATGEEIYAQLCARCHGVEMEGGVGPALGPGTNAAMEDDEYLEFTILNGRGRMPSFQSLQGAQVDRLVEYLREVQGE